MTNPQENDHRTIVRLRPDEHLGLPANTVCDVEFASLPLPTEPGSEERRAQASKGRHLIQRTRGTHRPPLPAPYQATGYAILPRANYASLPTATPKIFRIVASM